MAGFRGPKNAYAGVSGADLSNAPSGPVPFTSPIGLPITRVQTWYAGGVVPGAHGGVPGIAVQRVSGNPGIATAADAPVEQLPYGGRRDGITVYQERTTIAPGPGPVESSSTGDLNIPLRGGLSQFGYPRVLQQGQESAVRAPGNAPVGYSNDKLVAYDRHGMFKVGYENSGRNSGQTDPPMDGPARPSLWLVQRTINYQQGTDTTAATDDLSRDYSRNAEGMYIGEQGTGWTPVYGGVPGLFQRYGSYAGIAPDSPGYDPISGETEGIVSPVPQGMSGDGPQSTWSGPPHGLHSPTLPSYDQTIGRYMAIPQMARPRIDRPSNSPIAGQSYSQTVMPQGQTGTLAVNTQFGSGVAFQQRAVGNGWRGKGGNG